MGLLKNNHLRHSEERSDEESRRSEILRFAQNDEIRSFRNSPKVKDLSDSYETKLWQEFWSNALDPVHAKKEGIKNAQIEAPGTMFVPGKLYTIKIEHDGGLRIDVSDLSPILKGEMIK